VAQGLEEENDSTEWTATGAGEDAHSAITGEPVVDANRQGSPSTAAVNSSGKSAARFKFALANSGVLAFEHDTGLRYTWIYPTQFYEVSQVIGRTDADLFAADDARRLMDLKRRVLETGVHAKEEVYIVKDGRRHDYKLTVDPVRDAEGTIVGLTGVSMNISEAKQTQNELALTLEFRDKVIGILGHDLRDPLGAISAGTHLLLAQDLPEDARRTLARIDRSGRRMSEMIATLLDFADARFNSTVPISTADVDLRDVVRAVIDELLAMNPDRMVKFDAEGDTCGRWDAGRLAQVASNLIGNALKHGARDGAVRATLRGDDAGVVLQVKNDGPPIVAERLADIFKPFHGNQAGGGHSAQRGLGLGLYIVDQIIRAHEGSIEVTSSSGAGTVFSVRLPRRRAAS
jgi:signal transduction histidine kinase